MSPAVAAPEQLALDGLDNVSPARTPEYIDLDAVPAAGAPPSQIEIFRLGGVVYSIPDRPRVNLALKYLWLAKTRGEEIAGQWMLEELLGVDAYQALMDFDGLTDTQFAAIMNRAQQVVLGSLEQGKG